MRGILILLAVLALAACTKENSTSDMTSDELAVDQRIILKEGHSVILIPESDKTLEIGASVLDGKLSILEIDEKGKSLSVTWNDEES